MSDTFYRSCWSERQDTEGLCVGGGGGGSISDQRPELAVVWKDTSEDPEGGKISSY